MEDDHQPSAQDQDDAATGHALRVLGRELFSGPRGLLLILVLLGWGGREATRIAWSDRATVSADADIRATLAEVKSGVKQVHADQLALQVKVDAVVQSLPAPQRIHAQQVIEERLAVLRLADRPLVP